MFFTTESAVRTFEPALACEPSAPTLWGIAGGSAPAVVPEAPPSGAELLGGRSGFIDSTPDEFLRAPIGRFVRGATWLMWVASPTLCGLILNGSMTPGDMMELLPLLQVDRHPCMELPLEVIVDARGALGLDDDALRQLTGLIRSRGEDPSRSVARLALLPPRVGGVIYETSIGFYRDLEARITTHRFALITDALHWLGYPTGDDPVEAIHRVSLTECPNLVAQVRSFLLRRPRTATLADVAQSLGVEEKLLAQRLKEEKSSFRQELDRARFERASERLLATTDTSDVVARDLGMTPSSLCRLFRRAAGMTPGEFREQRGAGRQEQGAGTETGTF